MSQALNLASRIGGPFATHDNAPSPADLKEMVRRFVRDDFPWLTEMLVNESSTSRDENGLHNSAQVVALVAREMLGTDVPITTIYQRGKDGIRRPFVIVGSKEPSTLFVAHHDMVEPVLPGKGFGVFDGGRLFGGPGVHDDKGPIVMGLKAMALMQRFNPAAFAQTAIFVGGDEEIGSDVGRIILAQLSETAQVALGLEGAEMNPHGGFGQPYGVKVGRKGYAKYVFEYRGRAGHAGYAEFARADAGRAMRFHGGRIDEWASRNLTATVNIGGMEAPNATNQVAEVARFSVEARSFSPEELAAFDSFVRTMEPCPTSPGVSWEVTGGIIHAPWAPSASDLGAFQTLNGFAGRMGLETAEPQKVAGGGDINSVRASVRLDGLGGMGYGDHSQEERLVAESVPRAILYAYGVATSMTPQISGSPRLPSTERLLGSAFGGLSAG